MYSLHRLWSTTVSAANDSMTCSAISFKLLCTVNAIFGWRPVHFAFVNNVLTVDRLRTTLCGKLLSSQSLHFFCACHFLWRSSWSFFSPIFGSTIWKNRLPITESNQVPCLKREHRIEEELTEIKNRTFTTKYKCWREESFQMLQRANESILKLP